jgi:DMSO/TMAO reductase YedYZ molybdopterin-dependent catalytic subunit
MTTDTRAMSRRRLLWQGSAALAGLTLLRLAGPAHAFPGQPGEEVIPWLDQPGENPVPEVVGQQLVWEELDSWRTPVDRHFYIQHYGRPAIDARDWRLHIAGLVRRPMTLTLDELRARPRQEVDFTLECSGNHGFPWFTGGIGTARWAGTALAPLLQEAGILDHGIEVVFWGRDSGKETVREMEIIETFARSMSVADTMDPNLLLAYEMNGAPLPPAHGFPLRLIAPGWYGVANVKWLDRIEVIATRYQGRFMARDYVSIREEQRDGQTVWTFTSVGRVRLKSAPARVTRAAGAYRIAGAAWGAPIGRVEVQIDGGPWMSATLTEGTTSGFAWRFWTLDWGLPSPGEHSIVSRAVDMDGNVQPAPSDPPIATKRTYWESTGQITRRVRIPG